MNRRSFMTLASGLLVPWEPVRVYSFLPAWRLVSRWFFDDGMHYRRGLALKVIPDRPDLVDGWFRIVGPVSFVNTGELVVQRRNELDLLKSCDAYGYARPVLL